MKNSVFASLLVGALAFPGLLFAQESRMDKRQEKQDDRIEKGLKRGELTKKEARRLEKGQDRIEGLEDKAEADGKVTKREKRRIERAQDKQSELIRQERKDDQTKVK